MLYHALAVEDAPHDHAVAQAEPTEVRSRAQAFRLQVNVRRGNGSNLPGAASRYRTLDEARAAARALLHDDRVVQVTVVADTIPPSFVEWVTR